MNEGLWKKYLPYIACLSGQIIWGCSFLFTKIGLRYAEPLQLLALRFSICTVLMIGMVVSGKEELHYLKKKEGAVYIVLYAILQPTYYFLETYGLLYTNATFSGAFLAISPIFGIIIAAIWLKERPGNKQLALFTIPLAGVILMTVAGNSVGAVRPLGVVLLFLCCITSGTLRTINRRMSKIFTTFERTFVTISSCAVVDTALEMKILKGDVKAFFAPMREWRFLIVLAILVIFCAFLANMFVNYAAITLTVFQLSTLSTINPLCSVATGVLILGDPMTPAIFAGCVMVIGGIRLIMRVGEKED